MLPDHVAAYKPMNLDESTPLEESTHLDATKAIKNALESADSKMKSEEQGRNISTDNLNPITYRTIEETKHPGETPKRKSPKGSESVKQLPSSMKEIALKEDSRTDVNKSIEGLKLNSGINLTEKNNAKQNNIEKSTENVSITLKNNGKGKRKSGSRQYILNDSFLKLEQSALDKETLNFENIVTDWTQTPLYAITKDLEHEHEVINTLISIKDLNEEQFNIEEYKDLEILEFENEINIIFQALKQKAKTETLIINDGVTDSKESSKAFKARKDILSADHTFIHTSRYIVILENTLKYLLH